MNGVESAMSIKVMSFNIRVGSVDDGENRWENRKELVIDRIQNFDPGLLGIQECRDVAQAGFLKKSLRAYHFYGVRREGGGDTALEMAPILFRKAEFQISQAGCFWLSETPRLAGSKSWDSVFARTATWVELIHKPSSRTIIYLNTHFDYQPITIEESARLLVQWIEQKARQHPLIVTGDFNAGKDSAAYQRLTSGEILFDVFRQAQPQVKNAGTFHGYGQPGEATAIDWILASHHFEVAAAEIDCYHEDKLYPSDHFPVTAELLIKLP